MRNKHNVKANDSKEALRSHRDYRHGLYFLSQLKRRGYDYDKAFDALLEDESNIGRWATRVDAPVLRYIWDEVLKETLPFVLLPTEVAWEPPIRHHGDPESAGLLPGQFKLASGCIRSSRQEFASERTSEAREAGRQAIDAARRHRKRRQFNDDDVYLGGDVEIPLAGMEANERARREFRSGPFEVSRRQVFRNSMLTWASKTSELLPIELDRLTRPTNSRFPPVLDSCGALRNGKLLLAVNEFWLPPDRFALVPMPLPTTGRGSNVLALHVFLCGVDTRPTAKTGLGRKELFRRLGIATDHPTRDLKRILNSVNRHRTSLGWEKLAAQGLFTEFEIVPVGNQLRFHPKEADPICADTPPEEDTVESWEGEVV